MTSNDSLDSMLAEAGGQAEEIESSGWEQSVPSPAEQHSSPEPEATTTDVTGDSAIAEAREELSVPARPTGTPARASSSTDVDTASAIIRILDALRALESVEREVATHLVAQGKTLETEAETVLAVMEAPGNLIKTIRALLEARDLEPVERAFFLMKLERSAARNMAVLVTAFRNDISMPGDHIELARVLVTEIGELSSDDISNVEATESLFKAYEGDSASA